MISPYMVVDGLTWSDITGPGAIGETCTRLIQDQRSWHIN